MIGYLKKIWIPAAAAVAVFIVLMILIQADVVDKYMQRVLVTICINIMLALSANIIINISGQLTLGHSAFWAIGAYGAAICTVKLGLPFPIALIVGALAAALAGILIGLPTLRLKGDYLAITTLGFCYIVVVALQNIPFVGGSAGMTGIPSYSSFPVVFFCMFFTVILLYNLVHSKHGRAMISVREDVIAAQSMGINTTRYKIMAFTVGAFFAGLAGGLYAHFMMFIEPNGFNFMQSVYIVIYVVFGGAGSFIGCITSTTVLTGLSEFLRDNFGALDMVFYPVLLIVIMIARVKRKSWEGYFNKTRQLFRKPASQGGNLNG